MNPVQAMDRAERVAIMVVCGNMTEEQAEAYCNTKPDVYGLKIQDEKQEGLFACDYLKNSPH